MKKLLQNVLRASVLMAAAATFLVGCKKDDENKSIVTFMVKNGTEVVADAAVTFNGITNSAGNYIFTDINDGSYTYSIVKSGFETKTGNVTISGDKTVEVDLSGAEVATGEVSGNITQNTTWAKSVVMNGWIYVKSGATLTIKGGTLIKGKTGTKASLIIERGAKIMAIGTAMFLLPNKFSTGGVTGIATIVYYLFKIPLGTINIIINIDILSIF